MSDINSRITLTAQGADQVVQDVKKIQQAFEEAARAAEGLKQGQAFGAAVRQPEPPDLPPLPPPPEPTQPPPPPLPPLPSPQMAAPGGGFLGGAASMLSQGVGAMGGRGNLLALGGALPTVAGAIGAAGGPGGMMVAGAIGLLAAGTIKAINDLAENEFQRVQETFVTGIAQRMNAIGENVRATIIEEERRGVPASMVQSFLGSYSRTGGDLASLTRRYMSVAHPSRQTQSDETILNQFGDLATGLGIDSGMLGSLVGRTVGAGLDPSRLLSEVTASIAIQTHGQSRATEFYANIERLMQRQLETGVSIGQTTIDSIVGLQAAFAAGGLSADALNRTLEAVTGSLANSNLDSPEAMQRFFMLRRPGESVFQTRLRMETAEGAQSYLSGFAQMHANDPEMGMTRLQRQFGLSAHQAQGVWQGLMAQGAAGGGSGWRNILQRPGDATFLSESDPLVRAGMLVGADPAAAQEIMGAVAAMQRGDRRIIAGNQMAPIRGLERGALNLRTGINVGVGRMFGLTPDESVFGPQTDSAKMGFIGITNRVRQFLSGNMALAEGGVAGISDIGLGNMLSEGMFWNPELEILQIEQALEDEGGFPGGGGGLVPGGGIPPSFAGAQGGVVLSLGAQPETAARVAPQMAMQLGTVAGMSVSTRAQGLAALPSARGALAGVPRPRGALLAPQIRSASPFVTNAQGVVAPSAQTAPGGALISMPVSEPEIVAAPQVTTQIQTEPLALPAIEPEPQTITQTVFVNYQIEEMQEELVVAPRMAPVPVQDVSVPVQFHPLVEGAVEVKPEISAIGEMQMGVPVIVTPQIKPIPMQDVNVPVTLHPMVEGAMEVKPELSAVGEMAMNVPVKVNPVLSPIPAIDADVQVNLHPKMEGAMEVKPEISAIGEMQMGVPVKVTPEINAIPLQNVDVPIKLHPKMEGALEVKPEISEIGAMAMDVPVIVNPKIAPIPAMDVDVQVNLHPKMEGAMEVKPEVSAIGEMAMDVPVKVNPIITPIQLQDVAVPIRLVPELEGPVEVQPELSAIGEMAMVVPVKVTPEINAIPLQNVDVPIKLHPQVEGAITVEPEISPVEGRKVHMPLTVVPQLSVDTQTLASQTQVVVSEAQGAVTDYMTTAGSQATTGTTPYPIVLQQMGKELQMFQSGLQAVNSVLSPLAQRIGTNLANADWGRVIGQPRVGAVVASSSGLPFSFGSGGAGGGGFDGSGDNGAGTGAEGLSGVQLPFGRNRRAGGDPRAIWGQSWSDADLANLTLPLIQRLEGFSATPYDDVGTVAIGYGRQIGGRGSSLSDFAGMTTTRKAEDAWVYERLLSEAGAIRELVPGASMSMMSGLMSMRYNLGGGHFTPKTKLVQMINEGASEEEIIEEVRSYNKAGGQFHQGVANRREQEIAHMYPVMDEQTALLRGILDGVIESGRRFVDLSNKIDALWLTRTPVDDQ